LSWCVLGAALLLSLLGAARASAAGPRCVGAAARDPWRSCTRPEQWLKVEPTPDEARLVANQPCTWIMFSGLLYQCGFGVRAEQASATVALIGDSHASHWRAALNVLATRERWRGVSLARTHCAFSGATKRLPEPERSRCVEWNRQVLQWLGEHPEVSKVFVSEISGGVGVLSAGDQRDAQIAGYIAAWSALPQTVQQIVVIRDTPKMRGDTNRCVERAMAADQDAGVACAVPRAEALVADAAVAAARRWRSPRVRVADLTRWICNPSDCFPVVGGVLVFRDTTHMTRAFSETLGPYLTRMVTRSP
jgi:SGNH domain-containing protein